MIGRMVRSLLAVVVLGLVPFAPQTAEAAGTTPPPNQVSLKSITYGGTGCPKGSIGTSLSADRTSLTLISDLLVASAGPGVPTTEARKNCQLNLNLAVPAGWSYSIAAVDYRGYVQLPAGATAEHVTINYFQGQTTQASTSARFTGPVAKDYLTRSTVAAAQQVWSPCNMSTPLNINEQVRVVAPAGKQAQITTDSIDGKVKMILGLQWKKC